MSQYNQLKSRELCLTQGNNPPLGALLACMSKEGRCEYITKLSDIIVLSPGNGIDVGVVTKDLAGIVISDDLNSAVGSTAARGDNVGAGSICIGAETVALADRCTSIGVKASCTVGADSIAIGGSYLDGIEYPTFSTAANCAVIGSGSSATADSCVVVGFRSTASSDSSLVVGYQSTSQNSSTVIGDNCDDGNNTNSVILGSSLTPPTFSTGAFFATHRTTTFPGATDRYVILEDDKEARESLITFEEVISGYETGNTVTSSEAQFTIAGGIYDYVYHKLGYMVYLHGSLSGTDTGPSGNSIVLTFQIPAPIRPIFVQNAYFSAYLTTNVTGSAAISVSTGGFLNTSSFVIQFLSTATVSTSYVINFKISYVIDV